MKVNHSGNSDSFTLDDLLDGPQSPLISTTFVVVDLETTGGRTSDSGITEIGAVKIRAGEIIGEFQTFVNPGMPIPAFITLLTGITNQQVADAPNVESAIASFLEFAGFESPSNTPVLVAHNAPFDVGFLKDACTKHHFTWPNPRVLDTVTLARRALRNDEVRNRKLATLAEYFHSTTTPTHRALDDARATVDVLHGLIERLGNLGVSTYEELINFQGQATEKRRRKRNMAEDLPSAPGVYIFYDINNRPLYIGKSIDLRKRVMSYFTAAETRRRMNHMIELAVRVEGITCTTGLEAAIRELRLISEHKPRFNVRSRNPENTSWVSFTNERFPRLSIVRNPQLDNEARATIGPFRSRGYAQLAIDALHDATKIRQCTQRITANSTGPACALFEMNKCDAPCLDGNDTTDYNYLIINAQHALLNDPSPIVSTLTAKLSTLAIEERFEEAAVVRDRVEAFSSGVTRSVHIRGLRNIPELVAASPTSNGGWDIHVIRHGWLAASAHAPHGASPHPIVDAAIQTAATYLNGTTLVSETEMLISWLSQGTTRLVKISEGHTWHTPLKTRPYSADIAKRWLTDMRTVNVESADPVSID